MSTPADRHAGGYAVLTSPGPAAIASIRVWGPPTADFVARHLRWSRDPSARAPGQVVRAALVVTDGEELDDILVSVHAATPSWDLQLHLHGNPWLVRRCTTLLRACGLRPGDQRTTPLWPATDVLEAEALEQLPRVRTRRGAMWLLHQPQMLRETVAALRNSPDDDVVRQTCQAIAARRACLDWFTRPLRVAIIGPPNAGKSTLANALADRPVSIVTPRPGTTRDWVEVSGEVDGQPVVWFDTAGLRDSADPLEQASVLRTHEIVRAADAAVVVLDARPEATHANDAFLSTYGDLCPAAIGLNKVDRVIATPEPRAAWPPTWAARLVPISAQKRTGLVALCDRIMEHLGRSGAVLDKPAAFTTRQEDYLKAAIAATDSKTMQSMLLHLLSGERAEVEGC